MNFIQQKFSYDRIDINSVLYNSYYTIQTKKNELFINILQV